MHQHFGPNAEQLGGRPGSEDPDDCQLFFGFGHGATIESSHTAKDMAVLILKWYA
ncbi:MAG: hypothetical protein PVG84_07870 [Desulfobacterales bacterium]